MKLMLLLALLAGLVAQSGCGPAGGSPTKITNRTADASSQWSEDLFSFALENLNHLEDNDCEEMLRSPQQRLAALQQLTLASGQLRPNALLASWPEPDMLRQVVSRLNQWVDTQETPAESKLDPMLATLPAELAKLPMVENLGQAHYTAYDGYMLMEAVWLRDALRSKWAGGGTADELHVARSLFDWTVRNIQTDYDSPGRVPQVPWETLFLGHGTSWERAWTYILLLRQRGIDAALLALPGEDPSSGPGAAKTPKANDPSRPSPPAPLPKGEGKSLKPWCVGVLIGDRQKRLYLFDPKLGLPIPGPAGIAADQSGRLDVQPATLDQVVANPGLLDRLALDTPYWARKADLKRAVALVEASPLYLSPRAKRIESRLTGEQRLVLNAEPSRQTARFKAAGVGDVRLWELPYTTLQRRLTLEPQAVFARLWVYVPFMSTPAAPLYKGRIMQLKGRFFDEKEAIAYYQKARPRDEVVLDEIGKNAKACFEQQLDQAKKYRGGDLPPDAVRSLQEWSVVFAALEADSVFRGKLAASYWLGLIQYEQGDFAPALDYFRVRTLKFEAALDSFRNHTLEFKAAMGYLRARAPDLDSVLRFSWASGASYNIARTLEASGQRQAAIDAYESNIFLRNDRGNLLRARWLKDLDGGKKKPDGTKLTAG